MSEAWANILVLIAIAAASGLVAYGVTKAHTVDHGRQIAELKRDMLPRIEYESRHADILRNLSRIEEKLDKLMLRGRQ